MNVPDSIQIVEVAPRDGFQILPSFIPTEKKIALIEAVIRAGCDEVEASSFVSPKWVPQLSDAVEVCGRLRAAGAENKAEITYLVPNMKGAELAHKAGASHIFVTTSASSLHCRENLNQTIGEVFAGAERIAAFAKEHFLGVTVSIAAAFGYARDPEGVPAERVLTLARRMEAAGFSKVNLCDTAGEANPKGVFALCSQALAALRIPVSVHLHQREGIEFANALAAADAGVRIFEAAVGGLGGCPYVPKAKGNIATEKLARMFREMGYTLRADLDLLDACAVTAKTLQADHGTCADCAQ